MRSFQLITVSFRVTLTPGFTFHFKLSWCDVLVLIAISMETRFQGVHWSILYLTNVLFSGCYKNILTFCFHWMFSNAITYRITLNQLKELSLWRRKWTIWFFLYYENKVTAELRLKRYWSLQAIYACTTDQPCSWRLTPHCDWWLKQTNLFRAHDDDLVQSENGVLPRESCYVFIRGEIGLGRIQI